MVVCGKKTVRLNFGWKIKRDTHSSPHEAGRRIGCQQWVEIDYVEPQNLMKLMHQLWEVDILCSWLWHIKDMSVPLNVHNS